MVEVKGDFANLEKYDKIVYFGNRSSSELVHENSSVILDVIPMEEDGFEMDGDDVESNNLLDAGWEIDYSEMRRRRFERLSTELFHFGDDSLILHDQKSIDNKPAVKKRKKYRKKDSKCLKRTVSTSPPKSVFNASQKDRKNITPPTPPHKKSQVCLASSSPMKNLKKPPPINKKRNSSIIHRSSLLQNLLSNSAQRFGTNSTTLIKIGIYTPEARKERLKRFQKKRKERVWQKKIKYDCRKTLAAARPRVKGRFVKVSEKMPEKPLVV